jgi:hypothetical protein
MPAVDFVQIALEENPIYEGAVAVPTTGPNRIATEKLYLPGRSAVIRPNTQYKRRDDEFRSIPGTIPVLLDHYEPDGALSEYAYYDNLIWLLLLCGFNGVATPGGPTVGDPDTTTATGVNALNSVTLNVADTTLFAASGSFLLGGTAVTYTGKTPTSFTGVGAHAATVGGEVISNIVPATATKWVFTKRGGIIAQTAQVLINYADEAYQMKGNAGEADRDDPEADRRRRRPGRRHGRDHVLRPRPLQVGEDDRGDVVHLLDVDRAAGRPVHGGDDRGPEERPPPRHPRPRLRRQLRRDRRLRRENYDRRRHFQRRNLSLTAEAA